MSLGPTMYPGSNFRPKAYDGGQPKAGQLSKTLENSS